MAACVLLLAWLPLLLVTPGRRLSPPVGREEVLRVAPPPPGDAPGAVPLLVSLPLCLCVVSGGLP